MRGYHYSSLALRVSEMCFFICTGKAQNNALSYTEGQGIKAQGLGMDSLYGSKRHCGNGSEMEIRNAFLRVPFFSVPLHPVLCLHALFPVRLLPMHFLGLFL